MASTSNLSIQKSFKYDVFLSFRGKDTRKNFVDHLYYALQHKSIHTYKDDERIKKGKTISDELLKAIKDSKFYIIVFSKNYASSSWCLDELVQIMECHKMPDHTAYPVFYDVEPTEVRKQSGQVGEAFKIQEKEVAAGKWREVLKEAAGLTGWELKNTLDGHEAKFIQMIVEEISLELRFISSDVDENLIGMETRINDVVSHLETSADDVRMIGIKGMGGAGKTTLARAVYDKISILFEGTSFVENVREVSKGSLFGWRKLQKQVLSDIFKGQDITVSSVSDGKFMMKKMMCARKVLIVLDDIDHIDQLEALAGHSNWFKPGSRIIITTRDEQVLVAHKVNLIHAVNLLSDKEAIFLFNRYAFGKEIQIQGYKELSEKVVCYAAGLPLTIKVLGSFLCGKDELEWKDAIERLKTIPLKETLEKLELSYNSLEDDYKEIFLDVACVLKWWNKDEAIIALECCGFHARNGLRVLEQKSLITISEYGELEMHDHIEEMGKNIVRRLHPNKPNKHSRLWIDEEIKYILANDLGTVDTKCISVYTNEFRSFEVIMKGLADMKELRFLALDTTGVSIDRIGFDRVNLYLPNSLRFLRWTGYPFAFLHSTFQNLVGLDMHHSFIDQLWDDGDQKVLTKLKFLSITVSLLSTLDLRLAPNVERVSLVDSFLLEDLHMPAESPKLISLHLQNTNVMIFHLGITTNLENLSVHFFEYLAELHMPAECLKLKSLELSHLKLSTLHLGITPNLETLSLRNCTDMVELQIPAECPKLVYLELHNLNLRTLHLGIAPNLRFLYLSYLYLWALEFRLTPNLESLDLEKCYLVEVNAPAGCLKKLVNLNICASNPESSLVNICDLQSLRKLKLQGWSIRKAPKHLDRLECLDELRLWSTDIKYLPDSICMLKNLTFLELKFNRYLEKLPDDLGQLKSLEELILYECLVLRDIPNSICEMKRLEYFYLSNCILVETLPEEIGRLECLKRLDIEGTSIRHLPQSIYRLKGLCISGSTVILESCGLTSEIQTYENETFCYI